MFRFAQPLFLYLLLFVPLMWALYLYARHRRRRNLAAFGNTHFLSLLAPDVSRWRPLVKMILQSLAFVLIVFILARPQFGTKLQTVKTEGVEIMIALDVSNSMLARDINPSRLDKAKMMLSKLVDDFSIAHVKKAYEKVLKDKKDLIQKNIEAYLLGFNYIKGEN